MRAVLLIGLLGFSVAACSYSLASGIAGFAVTAVAAAALLLGTATTTTGCGPCLSTMAPIDGEDDTDEPDAGPCLGFIPEVEEISVEPCLDRVFDAIEPDAETDEPDIGPCLSPPEDVGDEPEIGPCLDRVPDDIEDDTDEPDIGPCLSPPVDAGGPQDVEESDESASSMAPEAVPPTKAMARAAARSEIRQRLAKHGVLPADVAKRLGVDVDEA